MDSETRRKLKAQMEQISAEIEALGRLVEADQPYAEVLERIAELRSKLHTLSIVLLTDHLENCVLGHGTGSEHLRARPLNQEQLLQEVHAALSRLLK